MPKKKPIWVRRVEKAEKQVGQLMICCLWPGTFKVNHFSDSDLKDLETQVFDIDFETGATSEFFHPYFVPQQKEIPKLIEIYKQADDPGIDSFTNARFLQKAGCNSQQRLDQSLAMALVTHAANQKICRAPYIEKWPRISHDLQRITDRVHKPFHERLSVNTFQIIRAMQVDSLHQSHRQVWIISDEAAKDKNPTPAELLVLASWMSDGYHWQRKRKSDWGASEQPQNQVFPTLIISFQPRAQARILYGYYDESLKVGISRVVDFDTSQYLDQMDSLLRWAFPTPYTSTTKPVPLPTIMESEDDVSHAEEMGRQQRPHPKRFWKRGTLRFGIHCEWLMKKDFSIGSCRIGWHSRS